jgi:hypothetical protein
MSRKITMTLEDFNKSQVNNKRETKDYFEVETRYGYDYDNDSNHNQMLTIAGLQCYYYNKEKRELIDGDEKYMLLTVKFKKN